MHFQKYYKLHLLKESIMNNYFLIHTIVFIASVILYVFPPRHINSIYGYRTTLSMHNDTVFRLANKLSSKLMMIGTMLTFGMCVIIDKLFHFSNSGWLIIIPIGLTIFFTERKLKKIKQD